MRPKGWTRAVLLLLPFPAVASGTWSPSGDMVEARGWQHVAVTLAGGRVLVVGGNGDPAQGTPINAEVYDPAIGTWSPTLPLAHDAQVGMALAPLGDGRALLTGGYGNGLSTAASIYDPATNAWTPAANMLHPRGLHTATLLLGGSVLVAGGDASPTAEIYNPITDSWSSTSPMHDVRDYLSTATRLKDGRVLVVGGAPGGTAGAEIFNPLTNSWIPSHPVIERPGLREHSATLLADGRVLVAGGLWFIIVLDEAQIYNPSTGQWSLAAPLPVGRWQHAATGLCDGRALIVGGDDGSVCLSTTLVYDPQANSWSPDASMAAVRSRLTAVTLPGGRVLVSGSTCGGDDKATEIFAHGGDTADGDAVPDGCDNCDLTPNPDQADNDVDGAGDACDLDDDNDGCEDGGDEDPFSPLQVVGTWIGINCSQSGGTEYGFAGVHSDVDGLLDCADPDNDGDGEPDVDDPCPVTPDVDTCANLHDCGFNPLYDLCEFAPGSCLDLFLMLLDVVNPDPTTLAIFEHLQVVSGRLYVHPPLGEDLAEAAGKFATAGGAAAQASTQRWRLEAWRRATPGAPEEFVAVVAEYDPSQVEFGPLDRGALLLVTPPVEPSARLLVEAAWTVGAMPGPLAADADDDEFPDPFDNCRTAPNAGQADIDGDLAGDVCDCAPEDDTAFALPQEVTGLSLSPAARGVGLSWLSGMAAAGSGTVHDVLRGALDELPVGGGDSERCLASAVAGTSATDATAPGPRRGFWYDLRGSNACGTGPYGAASDGTVRVSDACP